MSCLHSVHSARRRVAGLLIVVLSACSSDGPTAEAPKATSAVAVGQTSGVGVVGGAAPYVPNIQVTDATGKGVRNVLIRAEVNAGSGSISVIDPVTDGAGVATVGAWTLGTKKGAQTLTLTAPGLPPVVYTVTAKGFDLVVRYVGAAPSTEIQAAFETARNRVEQIVMSELAEQPMTNVLVNDCLPGAGTLNETIDDMLILVNVTAIDGALGVNGQAAACGFRLDRPFFPYLGRVQIDEADAARLLGDGSLSSVILHEMLHAIGFGSAWSVNALTQGAGGASPVFIGTAARNAYTAAGGTNTLGVPVANVGPVGTRDAHWRESSLGTELMTSGYQAGAPNPLSAITIGSLADLGYVVSYASADAFTVPSTSQSIVAARGVRALPDVIAVRPIVVDRTGRAVAGKQR